jgi:hypothetical protein
MGGPVAGAGGRAAVDHVVVMRVGVETAWEAPVTAVGMVVSEGAPVASVVEMKVGMGLVVGMGAGAVAWRKDQCQRLGRIAGKHRQ